jgi:hypothetical protein
MGVHVQPGVTGCRGHVRCGLLDPLERLGDHQLALAGPDGTHVDGGDRRP